MFRKTVLTSAIIGAGLVTSAGAAFAGDAPSGHHGSDHHSGHSSHSGSSEDASCSNGVGTGDKQAEGALAIGNVLDAPITSNVCNVLNDNVQNNLNGNRASVSVADGLLGDLLGGTSAVPSAQQESSTARSQAAPAETASTQQVQQAAPASAEPDVTTQKIQ